jgi:hypothetical protein
MQSEINYFIGWILDRREVENLDRFEYDGLEVRVMIITKDGFEIFKEEFNSSPETGCSCCLYRYSIFI